MAIADIATRAAFETAATAQKYHRYDFTLFALGGSEHGRTYLDPITEAAWQIWEAAHSANTAAWPIPGHAPQHAAGVRADAGVDGEAQHRPWLGDHSPLPWRVTDANAKRTREIVAADGSTVAKLVALDIPNAELIVASVNAAYAWQRLCSLPGTILGAADASAVRAKLAELLGSAEAVVARWETPKWKDEQPTAGFIYRLRDAVAALRSSGAGARTGTARDAEEWSFSTNGERYHGCESSRIAILRHALAEIESDSEGPGAFWIGRNIRFSGTGDADIVIQDLQERANEECGEFAETYLKDVTGAEKKELADLITEWTARVDRSNFWTVTDTEHLTVESARELVAAAEAATTEGG